MQTVGAVLAANQESTSLGERQQPRRPVAWAQEALGRLRRDTVENGQHLEPALLCRAEPRQYFTLDVRAEQ